MTTIESVKNLSRQLYNKLYLDDPYGFMVEMIADKNTHACLWFIESKPKILDDFQINNLMGFAEQKNENLVFSCLNSLLQEG